MKRIAIAFLLAGAAVACKSTDSTEVTDTSAPAAAEGATECSEMKAECTDATKAECSEAKVCPVTGKTIN